MRVLLDSGSSHSFIALEWVTKLSLKRLGTCNMNIKTFGKDSYRQTVTVVEAKVCKNLTTPEHTTMKFLAVDKHVNNITCYKLTKEQKESIRSHDLQLADPEADCNGKLPIDILIGAEYYHALQSRKELCLPGGLVLTQSAE